MSTSRHQGNGIIVPNRTHDESDMLEIPGLLEVNISRNDVCCRSLDRSTGGVSTKDFPCKAKRGQLERASQ